MPNPTLSVVIPAYNEEKTIQSILDKIVAVELIGDFQMEIVVVNDHSTDRTESILGSYKQDHQTVKLQLVNHEKNKGKGAAIHTGIEHTTGDYLIIQDAVEKEY